MCALVTGVQTCSLPIWPDVADVLISDHAPAIDDKGFGHAAGAERHLHPAAVVKTDFGERIAMPRQKRADRSAGIADRNRMDHPAMSLQRHKLRRFGGTGPAPPRTKNRNRLLAERGRT